MKRIKGFTPGPWVAHDLQGDGTWSVWRDGTNHFVTDVTGTFGTKDNAQLIAAAPDLYSRVLELEAENRRMRNALEAIVEDERPWHTCLHYEIAQQALEAK